MEEKVANLRHFLSDEERNYLVRKITDLEGIDAALYPFLDIAQTFLRVVPGLERTAETHVYRLALELWCRYRGVNQTKH
jgi:hypothetical protein